MCARQQQAEVLGAWLLVLLELLELKLKLISLCESCSLGRAAGLLGMSLAAV